ncbi:General stress protein 13 [Urinicoccus massiliensis]|uniref:General stress protein 13 n=1 Tax=Urinicoccus massiliensis TaxID=1723382 RepID=A0A8H2M8B3_9FIRM|nr:S1 RNA-binding domain-containing protein [Urinicoccus massiliensis]KGF10664.1 RNA-binding protein S1 [Tissierellia bacterium S5-A11]VFB16155.1 General stress protein 13 [Urinicoccus massiliensis]
MSVKVNEIVEGVVTGITNFGAFVQIDEETSGLVHISEISDEYVEKTSDFLERGQKVKVKVVNIDKDGKIGLSIKKAQPPKSNNKPVDINWLKKDSQKDLSFEDKMAKFLKESNEKIESVRQRNNSRGNGKWRK